MLDFSQLECSFLCICPGSFQTQHLVRYEIFVSSVKVKTLLMCVCHLPHCQSHSFKNCNPPRVCFQKKKIWNIFNFYLNLYIEVLHHRMYFNRHFLFYSSVQKTLYFSFFIDTKQHLTLTATVRIIDSYTLEYFPFLIIKVNKHTDTI